MDNTTTEMLLSKFAVLDVPLLLPQELADVEMETLMLEKIVMEDHAATLRLASS
jgi:hypothetical protein